MKVFETPLAILSATVPPLMPIVMQAAAQAGADVSFSVTEVGLVTVLIGGLVTALVFVHKALMASKDDQIKALAALVAAHEQRDEQDQKRIEAFTTMLEANLNAIQTVTAGLEAVRTRIHEWGNQQTPFMAQLSVHMDQGNKLMQAVLDMLAQQRKVS